jgi:UPF0755 protein
VRKRALLFVILIALLAAGAAIRSLYSPYRAFSDDVFLRIEHGTGTLAIGQALADAGVIRYPWQFWLERSLHRDGKIQAGEYRFYQPDTVATVFNRMVRGDIYFFEFTVKEGNNIFDIAESLETAGVMPAADFLAAARDASSIRDLDPQAPSLEG